MDVNLSGQAEEMDSDSQSSAEELYAVSACLNPPAAKVPHLSWSKCICHSSGKVLSGSDTKLVAISRQSWILSARDSKQRRSRMRADITTISF